MTPSIAVILTDPEYHIQWVNDDFTTITGYTLSEIMGKKPDILQGPESDQKVIQRIRKGLEEKTPLKEELINYRKNGEHYLCKLVIYPIFDHNQKLTNFIAFEVDGGATDDAGISLLQLDKKYSSSSLKGLGEIKLYYQLKNKVESEKLYLQPNLTLKQVAEMLSTNTKYLSQVVNHCTNNNFQYFINSYRVEYFKELINQDAHKNLTLYGVARQSGFKNKSTFYKVFKELVGQTPKDYMRSLE